MVFAYSDVSHEYVMHKASEALAAGANFLLLGPDATMLKPAIPTVAVTAVRTGVGKSQTTRAVAATLKEAGKKVVAVRHPMPYGDLTAQRVQRFAELEDLDRHHCTIEEREEYEPHITSGTVIYAGVDYAAILEQAQAEGDVLAVGRREQRPPVLPPGRPHRARRSAPGRPRDAVPPRARRTSAAPT